PARYYRPFAGHLRDAGLAVLVADLRGTGDSSPPPSRHSRYGLAELAADIGAILDAQRDRLAGRTVLLVGHSLGGQAALLHLGTGRSTVDGVVLLGVWPGWRFGGRPARGVVGDWADSARHGR